MATIISGGPSARRVASSSSRPADAGDPYIHRYGSAGALRNGFIEDIQISGGKGAEDGKHPILDGDAVPWRALRRGVGEEGQKNRKGEMDGAGLGVIEDTETNNEGQRRCDPKLKQRPCQGNAEQYPLGDPSWCSGARIRLSDEILQVVV